MNAAIFTFGFLAVATVGFYIFLHTPAGKRWLDNL
jgi:hypothetical protein